MHSAWVSMDGVVCARGNVRIRPDDHGFRYGMCAREVVRVRDGRVPLFPHYVRMREQCVAMRIVYDPPFACIAERILGVCAHAQQDDVAVQWTVSAGVPNGTTYDAPIELIALERIPQRDAVDLHVLAMRIPMGEGETAMRMRHAQGRRALLACGTQAEGLFLTQADVVGDATSGDVYWYADGCWHSAEANTARMSSVTHIHVQHIVHHTGHDLHACAVSCAALADAEEVCIANAIEGVVRVRSLTDAQGRTTHYRTHTHTDVVRLALFDVWSRTAWQKGEL
ncbi:MAG: aminotransferase class IV [Paenibacillaceae bacterium]|nr:aminotransferase class IV [Paenibacillaceae bacterium]